MTGPRPERQSGLGRGRSSLIPQRPTPVAAPTEIPISRIKRNPYQPRQRFDDAELQQLASSIRDHGLIQPVLVTETLDGYQLVAGERRVRAAELAGLERVPAIVRQIAPRDQLELALVENLQREDLDPLEQAHAYKQLIDEFGFTQEQLAARVTKARSTVANTLRLLDLAPEVQDAIASGLVTEGHGRALGALEGSAQTELLGIVLARDLSVRQTEELARRLKDAQRTPTTARTRPQDPDLERVEDELRQALGTKVSLARSRRGGRIVIEYYSDEELTRLFERLTGAPE
ncbi:MAG TPA: ParB/RepB/Spo0J family partition protein [Candidatus Dormibacteraeota bacterium]|nr:ParB/RepB/Spo0J family partition protein [Candidatus Dormibacteraeota bacterium]